MQLDQERGKSERGREKKKRKLVLRATDFESKTEKIMIARSKK